MNIFVYLLVEVLLLFFYGIFSAADGVVFSASDNDLEELADDGNKAAKRVLRFQEHHTRTALKLEVLLSLCSGTSIALTVAKFYPALTDLVMTWASPVPRVLVVAVIWIVLIVLNIAVFVLFGSVLPRRLVSYKPEKAAMRLSGVTAFFGAIVTPISASVAAIATLFLKMGGSGNLEEDTVSEDEIRMLVDRGNEKGILDDDESEMIQNVFAFDDLTVAKITVHRTEVTMLSSRDTKEEWETVLNETRYTMYPVYGEDVDDVIGVLDSRDFFLHRDATMEEILENAVKEAVFVPETMKADALFKQMKKTSNNFAIVVDEYGGTVGIVTLYDLVEQLVGEMDSDEESGEPRDVEPIDEKTYRIQGSALLEDVNEILDIDLPTDEYETFGGYVFGLYGSVPEDGSQIKVTDGILEITSDKIAEHKVESCTVTLAEEPEEDKEDKEK